MKTYAEKPRTSLPEPPVRRWYNRDKAVVVEAIRDGRLSAADAMWRYEMSEEELAEWVRLYEQGGVGGLKVGAYSRCKSGGAASERPR